MSEVLNAPEMDIEARQQAWRAQADRSMALVKQALANKAFLKKNPHIKEMNNAISFFSVLISMKSGDRQEERAEETRASLWNVIMTRLGTQDIPARQLTGPLADGSERPRTLTQDAHLFPGPALVKDLVGKISTGSVTSDHRANFDSVVREIYPLIEADIKKRERDAIQAADPLRDQKLDEGYKDPLEGQILLSPEETAAAENARAEAEAAARTARQREALTLCINAMSDKTFREQNPGFVRVMDAIERFSKSRTAVEDSAQREEYEGALCRFFLTRNEKISVEDGMKSPVTREIETSMMRAIEKLGEQIPALRSFQNPPVTVLAEQAEQKRSLRSEAKGAAAEGDGRVPTAEKPTEITLKTEIQGSDFRECIRYFPQLVGRETAVQDTARNQKARLFINDMISDNGFRDARPDVFVLAQKITASAHKIAQQDLKAHRGPVSGPGSFDYFGACRNIVGTLWGALLLDKQDGGFHLPTREQTRLALAFFEVPGFSAKPVINEKGAVIGYESRGPGSPTEKLRENLSAAFSDKPEVVAEVPVAAAPVAKASSGTPRQKPFDAVKALRIKLEKLANGKAGDPQEENPEIVVVAEAEPMTEAGPQDVLAAEEAAPSVSRGEKNRLLAKRDIDLISAQQEGNVVALRPAAGKDVSQEPATGNAVPRVSSFFAKAAAVVLSVGTALGIGGDHHAPESRVAKSEAPSFVSRITSFFERVAGKSVAPAYAGSDREEKRGVTAAAAPAEPGMK